MTPVTLGLWLEARRKEAELSLDEVSQRTKVHPRFLDALERGDEGSLPTKVHARAFALAYAKACGAGEEEAAKRVREAFPTSSPQPPSPLPSASPIQGAKARTGAEKGEAGDLNGAVAGGDVDVAADLVLQPEEELWPWKQWVAIAGMAVAVVWGLQKYFGQPSSKDAGAAPAVQEMGAAQGLSRVAEISQGDELALRARRSCWVVLEIDGKRLPTVLLEPDKKESWRVSQKAVVLFGNVGAVRVWWRGQNLDFLGELGARKNGVVFEVGQGMKEDPEQELSLPPGVPEKAPAQPE